MHKTFERLWMPAAMLIAVTFGYVWAGPTVLSPTSVEWLNVGDRAMHTLGWWFFREAPWGWPPGANPKLGLELASGVALSDSLPLFAFPFKLAAPLLPPQRITVIANGQNAGEYELSTGKPADVAIPLPAGITGAVYVTFRMSGPTRPSDEDANVRDTRPLGMALRSIELRSE